MRYPRVLLACLAIARAERRDGAPGYAQIRANDLAKPDPRVSRDGVSVSVHSVDAVDGTFEVAVYRPDVDRPLPVHVYLHGGGFCYGSTRNSDAMTRELAASGMVVVSVDYRLAPEHPWPVPVDDAYRALTWAQEHTSDLGGTGVLTVGGSSAGGALAAAAALMARDQGGPALAGHMLDIPVLDLTMSTGTSLDRYARGYLLTKAGLAESYDYYVPDRDDRRDPYASPVLAPDVSGMPPLVLVTCQYDPLRDEGEAYAARLRAAGVPVEAILARGHVHSSAHTPMRSAVRIRAAATAELLRLQGVAVGS